MAGSTVLRFDLEGLDREIAQLEGEYQVALATAKEIQSDLELKRQVREIIVRHSVEESPEASVASDIGDDKPDDNDLPLANKTTREGVHYVLRSAPRRVYSLSALVEEMRQLGFTGTQNAVHVQLSRHEGDGTIRRVKPGHYMLEDRPPRPITGVVTEEQLIK
jgi:hypothetical protein